MAWKWDRILYDRDGWRAGMGRNLRRLEDGSVVVRIGTFDEQAYSNDVYAEHAEELVWRSADGGLTWELYDGPLIGEHQTLLSDGTLVEVSSGGGVSLEEKQQLLADVGANPETAGRGGNDLWPESKRAELERDGYVVETTFPGIVGTLTSLSCSRSFDGGKTYEHRPIESLPRLARVYGSFRRCIELRDGTLLAACAGNRQRDGVDFSFALRSADKGASWDFHPVAEDLNGRHGFNETEILELPDGRIIAMMRCHDAGESVGNYLYQSVSDDGGVSWSPFQRTPIWGYPAQLILLKSGNILCTYAHRRHPFGHRACLSHDLGETWDYENEKIIRDDSLPGLVGYPTSIQLEDETILTAYAMSKIPRIPYREDDQANPDDDLLIHARVRVSERQNWHGGYHGFAGVSRYTEDYVRAPGQVTNRTMFDVHETIPSGGNERHEP